jgi:hypothetical protein
MSGQFTKVNIFHIPGKHKRTVKGDTQGQKIDMCFVLNGDEAWMQMNGGEPKSLPVINPGQGVYPNDNLGVLVGLTGSALQLSVLPTEDINGRTVHCIRVNADGQWLSDIFFDKETHLLIASKKELFDSTIGLSRAIETYYSDYKMIDGLNLPMSTKFVVDGETTAKIKIGLLLEARL